MFKSFYRKLILAVMQSRFYAWLLMHVVPYIRFSVYYTSLRGKKYAAGYALLKPGHILLTIDRKKLTTLLIPGEFTHAALCVGKVGSPSYPGFEVAEMTHSNFTQSHFFDICKESDRVVILECTDFDHQYVANMIEECLEFKDATYDVAFDLGVKALYCSELVWQADFEKRLQVSLDDLVGIGRPYISPTGLSKAKNVRVVWDSDKETM